VSKEASLKNTFGRKYFSSSSFECGREEEEGRMSSSSVVLYICCGARIEEHN